MLLKTQFRKGLVRCQCWMKKRNHVRININLTSSPKRHKYHTGKHSVETIWINLNAISDEIKIVEIVEMFTHFSLYTAKRWNTWRVNRQWALTFRRLYTCFLVVKIVYFKVGYCFCHQTWRKNIQNGYLQASRKESRSVPQLCLTVASQILKVGLILVVAGAFGPHQNLTSRTAAALALNRLLITTFSNLISSSHNHL